MSIYVFDMGKVIIKSADMKTMYEISQPECDYPTFNQLFYGSNKTTEAYKGMIEDIEFFKWFQDQTKSKKTPDELLKLYLKCKMGTYQDTLDQIEDLKRRKKQICLLSNLKRIDFQYLKTVMDTTLFDKLFLSYEMGMVKPELEIFQTVIQKLGTNQFHFFDDNTDNINSAHSLGIKTHQVTGDTIKECFQKCLK